MKNSMFFKGVKDAVPILLGYFAVAFTFGISAVAAGISPIEATLLSAANLTSAGQFAALSIIEGSLSYFEMMLTQLVINLRYCLMSSALTQKFENDMPPVHRYLIAYGNTDEVFALCSLKEGKLSPAYCYGAISMAFPGWVLGTLTGAIFGGILPQRILSALGIALYAMFIAIILPGVKKDKFIAAIIGASMLLNTVFFFAPVLKSISAGFRIIIITVIISSVAAIIKPIDETEARQ